MKIADLMSTELITANEADPVLEYVETFKDKRIHHMPVVDETGEVAGLVSSKDIESFVNLSAILEAKDDPVRMRDIMTAPVFSYFDDVTIDQAAQAMLDNRIHAIVAVNRNTEQTSGILTSTDILRYVASLKPGS